MGDGGRGQHVVLCPNSDVGGRSFQCQERLGKVHLLTVALVALHGQDFIFPPEDFGEYAQ